MLLVKKQNGGSASYTRFSQLWSESDTVRLVQCVTRCEKQRTETENRKHWRHGFFNLYESGHKLKKAYIQEKVCQAGLRKDLSEYFANISVRP